MDWTFWLLIGVTGFSLVGLALWVFDATGCLGDPAWDDGYSFLDEWDE